MNAILEPRIPSEAAACNAAAPLHMSAATALPREFLSFRLGSEEYGLDILRVQEIRSYESPTRIAGAPPCVKGVVNLRGVIVPLVDLRLSLDSGPDDIGPTTAVIVLCLRKATVGIVVDSVCDVIALGPESIKPAPTLGSSISARHILGIGCVDTGDRQRMLILIDIETLLSDTEPALLSGATAQGLAYA